MAVSFQKIVGLLQRVNGAKGGFTLRGNALQEFAAQDNQLGRIVRQAVQGTNNPTLTIASKSQSNYAIAGLRIKDGKKVVASGAVSLTNPGSAQGTLKYRLDVHDGNTVSARGFLDASKQADTRNMALNMSRQGGILEFNTRVGDAMAHRATINEEAAVDLAKQFEADNLLKGYARFTKQLQRKADGLMVDARNAFRSNYRPSTVPPADRMVGTKQVLRGESPVTAECTKVMLKPRTAEELTKFKNIEKCTKHTDFKKLDKAAQDKFFSDIKINSYKFKKPFNDADIQNLIKKYKKD